MEKEGITNEVMESVQNRDKENAEYMIMFLKTKRLLEKSHSPEAAELIIKKLTSKLPGDLPDLFEMMLSSQFAE